jgi:hypothetical protein
MNIISTKDAEGGKTYYIERYEDDQFGFVLSKRDATRFDLADIDRVLRRLNYDYPHIDEFKVKQEPIGFRIVAK